MSETSFSFLKKRKEKYTKKLNLINKDIRKLSLYRLLSFLAFCGSLLFLYISREYLIFSSSFASASLLIFIFLLYKYNLLYNYSNRLESILELIKREILRSNLQLNELYRNDPIIDQAENSHYWKDLGIFGRQGLYSYLDTTVTSGGNQLFIDELLQKETPQYKDLVQKQKRIIEISEKKRLYWKLLYLLYETSPTGGYSKNNIKYSIESITTVITNPKRTKVFINLFLFFGYSLSFVLFILDQPGIWGAFFFIQILIYMYNIKKRNKIIKKYVKYIDTLNTLKEILKYFSKIQFKETTLKEKLNTYTFKEISDLIKITKRLDKKLSYREIPLPGFILNLFISLDYSIIKDIYEFEKMNKISIENLTSSVEFLDSLLPFCTTKFHQNKVEFPKIIEEFTLSAEYVGHPLIPSEKRVYNPLSSLKKGEIVLITGSNMSGKTTFLRTIGVNVLLANCGAAVCVSNMVISPMKIFTSIKNEDSLSDGVSFFYSEVKKLSYILRESEKVNCIILIDEVLKGTNTRERLIATKSILQRLSEKSSFNYITTHDIEIAKENNKYILKHFTEVVENDKMGFDYLIRDGVITSGNALKILSIECPELKL
jgi:energy-coupling factor transporter ATP-binding protein EcfA2